MLLFLIVNVITIIIYMIVHQLVKTKTKPVRKIIWGSLMIFPLSIMTAFAIGINYNFFDRGSPPMGFEMALYSTPLLIAIGLIILGIGITGLFKHKKTNIKK